jgi:hypothetical protein
MLRRALLGLVAAAALATSASVLVVALAFALYAVCEPLIGRAGAASAVAGAAALLIGLLGLMIGMAARAKSARRSKLAANTVGGLIERVIDFAREKPLVAVSAAIGAGFMAVRNPTYLGSAIRAFLEGERPPRRK